MGRVEEKQFFLNSHCLRHLILGKRKYVLVPNIEFWSEKFVPVVGLEMKSFDLGQALWMLFTQGLRELRAPDSL